MSIGKNSRENKADIMLGLPSHLSHWLQWNSLAVRPPYRNLPPSKCQRGRDFFSLTPRPHAPPILPEMGGVKWLRPSLDSIGPMRESAANL